MRDLVGGLMGRVDRLQRNQQRAGGYVPGADWYNLRVAPTCPPSKQLHMHGGRTNLAWNSTLADLDDYEQRAYTVPDLVADLADVNSVYVDVTFVNANYYQFYFLELRTPAVLENPSASQWSFYLHGTGDEFATAGEAEAWMNSETPHPASGLYEPGPQLYVADGCAAQAGYLRLGESHELDELDEGRRRG